MTQRRYHDPEFWQQRYDTEAPDRTFEWYQLYPGDLAALIAERIPRDARILEIGCGNSELSVNMHRDGWANITATDYIDSAVSKMQGLFGDLDGLTFEVADARNLPYPDESFDAVIDKGTIDASDMGVENVPGICKQVRRVLRPKGVFLVISIDPPIARKFWLDRPDYGWRFEHKPLRNDITGATNHAYIMSL